MAKTAKERMRAYRERLKNDPRRSEETKMKDRKRWHERKKPICELPASKQTVLRKRWKKASIEYRQRQKTGARALQQTFTPPQSPAEVENEGAENNHAAHAGHKARGRKRIRKDRAKVYRDNVKLTVKLSSVVRTSEKFRKRAERAEANLAKVLPETPRRATKRLVSEGDKSVKKALIFHHALVSEINSSMSSASEKDRQVVSKVLSGKVLKKYRLINFAKRTCRAVSRKRLLSNMNRMEGVRKYERKRKRNAITDETTEAVVEFFERDDNTRISTRVRDTKTVDGEKKTKRYLLDSNRNLYLKFQSENPHVKISFSQFCKRKPFWVFRPKVSDRDTCLCKKHENLQLQADKLHELRLLQAKRVEDNMKLVVCDTNKLACMYGDCPSCPNDMAFPIDQDDTECFWWEWQTKREAYTKDNVEKIAQKTVKEKVQGTVFQLRTSFLEELKGTLCPHVFNIRHQFRCYRDLKKNLPDNEAVLHIDFSENWQCKYTRQIQSAHFGDSNKQATLHTGVCYLSQELFSFCTVSACRRHDPAAIWAHLAPVMTKLQNRGTTCVHFFSDGPTTQYRNRTNLYLFSTLLYEHGFEGGTWNFFESGHGKGAADAIGGAVKRKADDIVARGKDLPDPKGLYEALCEQESSIQYYFIDEASIDEMEEKLPALIKPVSGIMKIKQVWTSSEKQILTKRLSCFCSRPTACTCYNEKSFTLGELRPTEKAVEQEERVALVSVTSDKPDHPRKDSNRSKPMAARFHTKSSAGPVINDSSEPRPMSDKGSTNAQFSKDHDLLNTWLVVDYESKPYVGKVISQEDDSVEVEELRKVGTNKFVMPDNEDLTLWYDYDKLIATIPPPVHQTKRLLSIDNASWNSYFK